MKVLNKHIMAVPREAVYIGRPSKWGNPFQIGRDGTRKEVIEKFATYIVNSPLMNDLYELKNKDLVCFCAPLPCHGDVLLRLANEHKDKKDLHIEGMYKELHECEQIAAQALGYPWFKDDQKNFPGATEKHGVCIGEHVTSTIVQELASAYLKLRNAK